MPNPLYAQYPGCQTKFMQYEIQAHVRVILNVPDLATTRMLPDQTLNKFEEKASKVMQVLENGFDDATAVICFPGKYRKLLRTTTNCVERLIEEIRRRERVIRIFPNHESVDRIIGAVFIELDEKWATEKKFFDIVEYYEWRCT